MNIEALLLLKPVGADGSSSWKTMCESDKVFDIEGERRSTSGWEEG